MGNLVFQATLGGQVNLVGPNTASTFNLNVPAVSSTIATTSGTETLTNKTLTSPVISGGTIDNAVIGGTTAAAGSFTTLSASSTLSVIGAGTIQGLTVGKGAGSVATNTAVGASALQANTTGDRNSAFGNTALYSNQGGQYNVALGDRASYSNTSGSNNISIGSAALYTNSTGGNNVAIGRSALEANTTASNNTAVGYQAGYSNTTSGSNSYFGYQAGYSTTTSFGDVNAFGWRALYSNTTGYSNTAMGSEALRNNTTASNNTAVGYQAGYTNTTGIENTFVGKAAGYSITGSYCVGIGNNALQNATGSFNTGVGLSALRAATGTYNVAVGIGSGEAITSGSKNTLIGAYNGNQGGLDIRTASNYIVLSDGDGTPWGYCTSGGVWNFGYDTTSAQSYGVVYLKGSSATNYGPYLRYTNNGTFLADAGDYAAIVGSATHQYAIRCGASGGVYLAATATSWSAISDETQKNIIEPITDGLNKVASLRAVIGSYKSDEENTRHPFLIAQDVQAVLPEAVSQNDHDGESVLGLAYTEVIPLLVAAIKELKAEIDTLKGQA